VSGREKLAGLVGRVRRGFEKGILSRQKVRRGRVALGDVRAGVGPIHDANVFGRKLLVRIIDLTDLRYELGSREVFEHRA